MSFADSIGLSMCHIHFSNIILLGSLWVCFSLFYIVHSLNTTYSFFGLCISASTSYHLPSVTWKERFSQSLCVWLVCQCHGKARTLGPTKCQHPVLGTFTGSPLDQSASSALGRVTQSETPVPGLLSWVCYSLPALVVPLKDSHRSLYGITALM